MSAVHIENPAQHPFLHRPNQTILALSIPVLFSLIAEPITGLVDTAFVKELGAAPLAALGIGTALLSAFFWIFNFIGISAQTEVAQAIGRGNQDRACSISSLAMILSLVFGALIILVIYPFAAMFSVWLGAEGAVLSAATTYTQVRLWGAPAVLISFAGFGVLRGMQDMRTPLWIAVAINALNIVLNYPLIFGWGMIPALGIAGAATASVISQWAGALVVMLMIQRKLGFRFAFTRRDVLALFQVGGDMFVRTGLLTLFLLLATRVANQIGEDAGAAHQAIRTVWFFSALLMESFAVTSQSLVGYFLGAEQVNTARHAAAVTTRWGLGTGFALTLAMLLLSSPVAMLLVPPEAIPVFWGGWIISALAQPINALAFITDGIHWGTADYRFLRNAMIVATLTGAITLLLIDPRASWAFIAVWGTTLLWGAVRGALGIGRIWPGIGVSPLRPAAASV